MKKLLSLILTLALLSTMFVFGAVSASAAVATQEVTSDAITPEMIYVTQSTTDGVTTQTVSSMTATKSIDSRNQKKWALMRFDVSGLDFESISSATLNIYAKYSGSGYLYILPATSSDWELASNAIANNNGILPLADSNTLINRMAVTTSYDSVTEKLDVLKGTVKNGAMSARNWELTGNATDFEIIETTASNGNPRTLKCDSYGGNLIEYLNTNVKADYIYFAVQFYASGTKTSYVVDLSAPSKHSLVVTGERAIGGLGTKIIGQKTATVYLNDEIAYLVNGKEGNQYESAGNYSVNNCTVGETLYEKYLYLKADLTELAGKDIDNVVLKYDGRTYKYGLNLYVSTTASSWSADTITLDNAPVSTSNLILAENTAFLEDPISYTKDITSIVDLSTDTVLSLRFEVQSIDGATHQSGVQIFNVGNSSGNAPRLEITYTEELDTATEKLIAGTKFTFNAETTATGLPVMLLVAIYDSTGSIIEVEASEVLTVGTDDLVKEVDLANYEGAASVQCFFWNGTTLEPCMEVTGANVA